SESPNRLRVRRPARQPEPALYTDESDLGSSSGPRRCCGFQLQTNISEVQVMRGKGINYDTGFINNAGVSNHEPFDPEIVKREMRIIRDDLHCNAVRITGGDVNRLEVAATHAAAAGLEVWFCPFTSDLTTDELLDFLAD